MATVERTRHVLGAHGRLTTLEQQYRFEGHGATAAAIAGVLLASPLIGSESVFGKRPGAAGPRSDSSRTLRGFSPAPGFHFDVDLAQHDEGVFRVRFSQPDRDVPYLQGELSWTVVDDRDGAVLDEQINTKQAFEVASEPLTGPRPSLRRWLFFRAGHKLVMSRATRNIARILEPRDRQ
jgi:hypothetical protein